MKVPIHYGRKVIEFEIPEANLAEAVRPWPENQVLPPDSLDNLFSSVSADTFIKLTRSRRLSVLLPDGTRDFPWEKVVDQLFALLKKAEHIRFIICTGTHEAVTEENAAILERIDTGAYTAKLTSYDTLVHDCETARYYHAGQTLEGTQVLYNAGIEPADIFLALSDIKYHYFAGYSNPVKNLVPGVCDLRTAEQNHRLTFDDGSVFGMHPWHPDVSRREQPLAADQVEALEKIVQFRPYWALVTISTRGKLHYADLGPAQQVSAGAFAEADRQTLHEVERAERMIVSPGGHPDDSDLYIAQRALELTMSVLLDGGELLFMSACSNGIGPERSKEQFYNKLIQPLEEILTFDPQKYKLYSHKPYRFAQLISRLGKMLMYSKLDAEAVRRMHMTPTADPQEVIDGWIKENPKVKILAVDGANKLALRPKVLSAISEPNERELL